MFSWLWHLVLLSVPHLLGSLHSSHIDLKHGVQSLVSTLPIDFSLIEDYVAQAVSISKDPEIDMNALEIIRYHGYPGEEHDVITTDGYILTVHRIPYGKKGSGSIPRKPVIIINGLLGDSSLWVLNTPDKNLAYILADAGYDVWLSNYRGNTYAQRHIKLHSNQAEFWTFGIDEWGQYDVPETIDFVLKKTGFNQTNLIAYSMGGPVALIMLTSKPEYNAKVRSVMALAPAVTMNYVKTLFHLLDPFLADIPNLFGVYEGVPDNGLNKFLGHTLCKWPTKPICAYLLFLVFGFDQAQFNMTRLPVYFTHAPTGGSIQAFRQFGQIFNGGVFQAFDYGKSKNLKKYGQPTPPLYDLAKITTPLAIYTSDNDHFSTPEDNAKLASKLKTVVLYYRVPYAAFIHIDHVVAMNAKEVVYNKVLQTMEELWLDD